MPQGLLAIQSPEPRSELVCNRKDCMIIFYTVEDKINHMITAHLPKGKGMFASVEKCQEYHIRWSKQFTLPNRPTRRWNVTQTEMDNRKNHKCHCGKPKSEWDSKYRRLYCSNECSEDWNTKTIFWNQYRYRVLKEHAVKTNERIGKYSWDNSYKYIQTCDHCGKQTDSIDEHWDLDHIIAIMNGGHAWHRDNLQVLCEDCHKEKTRQDHEDRREKELQNSVMVLDVFQEAEQDKYQTTLV